VPDDTHVVLATIDMDERPVSIRVLGAYAESIGAKVTLLVIIKELARIGVPVTFTRHEIAALAAFLEREKATHLGFYLMTASLKPYAELVLALREAGFRGIIMAGGVHVALCPEKSLVEGADFAVQGPGELPLEMILAGKPLESIPGLVWRRGREVVVNPITSAQKLDLDKLPYPLFRFDRDWMLVDGSLQRLSWEMHRKHATWDGRYYDMITSRGCVYRCAYCCNVNGAPVRRSSVERVIGELRSLRQREPRITGVNFQDDCFYAGSDEWLKTFCSRMKAEVGLPFIGRMIPRYVTKERIEILKSGGLAYVTMGLEASDRLNREVFNRRVTATSFVKAATTVLESGLHLSIDVLIHNPYEKEEDLRQVGEILNQLPRPNWSVVALPLTPFPNTPLYERCVRDGTLDRFPTDAFDSMLVPSRPGAYRTPAFWLKLNTILLPVISPVQGAKLIAAGSHHPQAVRIVERMAARVERAQRVSAWLKHWMPWMYVLTGGVGRFVMWLRGLLGRRAADAVPAAQPGDAGVAVSAQAVADDVRAPAPTPAPARTPPHPQRAKTHKKR
jgi:hypothetical protein